MKKEAITLDQFQEGKDVEILLPQQQKEVKGGWIVTDDLAGF
jgi:hypothetical protein